MTALGRRMVAAAVLFAGTSSNRQRLLLRTMWSLVPLSKRRDANFRIAREFAPAKFKGLPGGAKLPRQKARAR